MGKSRKNKDLGILQESGELIPLPEGKRLIMVDEDDSIITKKQREYLAVYNQRHDDKTDFVWARFTYNKTLYPEMKPNVIARMFCLATFTDKEGFTAYRENIKIALNRIGEDSIDELIDITSKEGIITPVKTKYLVNREHFYRGDMEDSEGDHIRLYTKATRALYNSCMSTQHCHMAYIMQMIPFVNRQTNILCYNQTEQMIEHLERMTLKEYCKIMKIDTTGTHTSRTRKYLSNLRIDGELAVGFFNDVGTMEFVDRGKYAVVNPILYFGGDKNTEIYAKIRSLFIEEKKKFNLNNK